MAGTVKQARYFKTEEQKALLRARIAGGMKSATMAAEVEAAMLETGLTRGQVTEFIRNEKPEKKKRGTKYKKKSLNKKTVYGSFLGHPCSDFNFNGVGKELGNLTIAKAVRYRELQETESGRLWLEENRQNAEKENAPARLTAIQKHNRAVGIFNKVQKEIEVLNTLGYKAAMICYQPTKRPTVLGLEDAVHFFINDTSLMNEFDNAMGPGKVSIRAKQKRKILRQKVQTIFNRLYARSYGTSSSSPMPYTAIEAGTVQIMIEGLPDGIPFIRPRRYKVRELKAIINSRDALKIVDAPESTDMIADSAADIDSHPESSPQALSIAGNRSAPAGTEVQSTTQSHLDTAIVATLQTMTVAADGQVSLSHPQAVTSPETLSALSDPLDEDLRQALSRAQPRTECGTENSSLLKSSTASAEATHHKEKRSSDVTPGVTTAEKRTKTATAKRKRTSDLTPASAAVQKKKRTDPAKQKRTDDVPLGLAAKQKNNNAVSSNTMKAKPKKSQPRKQAAAEKENNAVSSNTMKAKPKKSQPQKQAAAEKEKNHTGRKIKQLFEMVKEKGKKKAREWYQGTIKQHKNGKYIIKFKDNESAKTEVYTYTEDQFLNYKKKKNLVFL